MEFPRLGCWIRARYFYEIKTFLKYHTFKDSTSQQSSSGQKCKMVYIVRPNSQQTVLPIEFVDTSALPREQPTTPNKTPVIAKIESGVQFEMGEWKTLTSRPSTSRLPISNATKLTDLHLCLKCKTGFTSIDGLSRHLKYDCSTTAKSYSCSKCKKSFQNQVELNKHMLTHSYFV
ncbi:protein snail homolog Sna [Cephus cinctus]|uniref:Protein snail homolog Sna n=1 Tax=Cephus cinctus TaxID=211228 RepID=A0AAJ7RB27_CEPCN|nr:protein snail homolog Sna [Cephus cinctus]